MFDSVKQPQPRGERVTFRWRCVTCNSESHDTWNRANDAMRAAPTQHRFDGCASYRLSSDGVVRLDDDDVPLDAWHVPAEARLRSPAVPPPSLRVRLLPW